MQIFCNRQIAINLAVCQTFRGGDIAADTAFPVHGQWILTIHISLNLAIAQFQICGRNITVNLSFDQQISAAANAAVNRPENRQIAVAFQIPIDGDILG